MSGKRMMSALTRIKIFAELISFIRRKMLLSNGVPCHVGFSSIQNVLPVGPPHLRVDVHVGCMLQPEPLSNLLHSIWGQAAQRSS